MLFKQYLFHQQIIKFQVVIHEHSFKFFQHKKNIHINYQK